MTVQAVFIVDADQRTAIMALNGTVEGYGLDPQLINNPLADNVGAGLGIGNLVGKYWLPARLLNDAGYAPWFDMFSGIPIYSVDDEMLFLPVEW